jgi:hypothetical protein
MRNFLSIDTTDRAVHNARRMPSAFHINAKLVIIVAVFLSVAGAQVPRSQPTIAYRTTMRIPAGTTVYIGPPAKPIPKEISDAIGTALGKIPEILEAYLPMVYIKGQIDPPAQVLVVVLEEKRPSPQAKITEVLRAVLPANFYIDVTESRHGDPNLPTIRATGTQLNLNRTPK